METTIINPTIAETITETINEITNETISEITNETINELTTTTTTKPMIIGDRMKLYEKVYEAKIPPYQAFIIRLDGKNFSKFTNGFKKPFDSLFTSAMIQTANDLTTKFNPTTGYTHSDEITLIFPPACTKEEYDTKQNKSTHLFDGRVCKLCSVLAGYCTARFNWYITYYVDSNKRYYTQQFLNKIASCETCFDARIVDIPYTKEYEIVNHMIWRSVQDCYRNCVQTYAYYHLGKKTTFKKHCGEMVEIMKENGFDFESSVPHYLKHGVYCKKELYEKTDLANNITNNNNNNTTIVVRQRIKNISLKIHNSDLMRNFLTSKNLPTDLNELNETIYNIRVDLLGNILDSQH
ncbi:MAG: tRNAHis guanylyltransferase [Homavirus sp.]|uniref:tRNAHis guanylyltransferase n=1 Tax=Homavirus sp. TaxID=2487769 RepID=A0A3G5A4T0_9VIRU|nr:MAG: tRNAHis guanylyltransferase [Homavirus sp.]